MRVDLHNHTVLCNHAENSVEDYIKKAIELNIDIYGFTDHAPMDFDFKYRMAFNQMEFYEKTVLFYKEKYKNDIDILLGYEVDFMQKIPMKKEVLNANIDYLIGSVHFLEPKKNITKEEPWGFDNPKFIGKYKKSNIDDIWIDYFEVIENMAKSNLFDVVGHLDLIKVFKFLPKKDIKQISKNALKQIKKANMVLEINSAGYRKPIAEAYPSKQLLEVAFDLNIPITFSSDAHSVEQIGYSYDKAVALAKSVGYSKCITFNNREKIELPF